MDYQRFFEQLPSLYENWEQDLVSPKSDRFQQILNQVTGITTPNVMQLLNFAVECLDLNEVYCEVGCFQGASLIAALLEHPDRMAYAVDNFSEFDTFGDSFEKLTENLSNFNLSEQVFFCNQDFEEFFCELKEIDSEEKIGVYFYDAAHDYRSSLMGLLLVKPFLAEQALIVVSNSNWGAVEQANWDFISTNSSPCHLLLDMTTNKDICKLWNGLQIFVVGNDGPVDPKHDWESLQVRRHQSVIKSIYDINNEERQKIINTLHNEAVELHCSGTIIPDKNSKAEKQKDEIIYLDLLNQSLSQAEKKYQEVLRWDANNADAWLHLGTLYYMKEQYQDALLFMFKSIEIDPLKAIRHYNLGVVLENIGDRSQAIRAYQETIKLDPQYIQAYNNLGNIFLELGEVQQAESVYRQGILTNPNHFGGYLNLGNILMSRQQIDEAIAAYETALNLKPRDPDILHNLGIAFEAKNDKAQAYSYFGYTFYRQGKYEEAISQFQNSLEIQTGDVHFYLSLAECYKSLNQYEEAIKVYQKSVSQYPGDPNTYFNWISTLQEAGQTQEAISLASETSKRFPEHLFLKREEQLILPIIYDRQEEIHFYRQRFTEGLEDLINQTSLDTLEARKNALIGISKRLNFYLQYQGKNDLDLLKQYGQLVHRIMAVNYPDWVVPKPMPNLNPNRKIRVGYVSDCMRAHTVGKLSLGWLRNCNRQQFEVYCYYINGQIDKFTQKFKLYSDVFHQIPGHLETISKQIIADELHILIFIDIGMHPTITQLAGLRLAPIQCTSWLHPITTGLPTIDYFLSSELMEPAHAEEHYSEKLINLPKIGVSYAKPTLPELTKTRADFHLLDEAIVYLSCQSLYKYLPQYDYIFAEIALQVPHAQFAFLGHESTHITDKFRERLQQTFANYNLNSENYCIILPRQDILSYWQLNLVSDIFLDTLSWSGGNTTLEAIACHLPIVTCPGEFMRGRHSYGILKMLGVTETIANTEAEYIEIAVKLGLEPNWRNSIVQQMIHRHPYLYDDKACVEELEKFYQRAVSEYQFSNEEINNS